MVILQLAAAGHIIRMRTSNDPTYAVPDAKERRPGTLIVPSIQYKLSIFFYPMIPRTVRCSGRKIYINLRNLSPIRNIT